MMSPIPKKSLSEMPDELSSGWLVLSMRIRNRMEYVKRQTAGTPVSHEISLLATDTREMCDHVERLHGEAQRLLAEYSAMAAGTDVASEPIEPVEVQRASVEIQREQHEQSANAMQVIKALFLWVDTPQERVREPGHAEPGSDTPEPGAQSTP